MTGVSSVTASRSPIRQAWFQRSRPTWYASLLFLLLFSGPPKFRFRDAADSLYGEIDLAIAVSVVVWTLGGMWVTYQLLGILSKRRPRLRLWCPQKLAIVVITLLAASTLVSVSPELTAFKVYQILVAFLFGLISVEWYGIDYCLDRFFLCSTLLCALITIFLVVDPDLVLFTSETGFPRLRGMGIADTGMIATFCIILLWTTKRQIPKALFWLLATFFGTLLFFSLARTAWIAVCVFFGIALVKRPNIRSLPPVYLVWLAGAVALGTGLYSKIGELRNPESIYNLSDRVGLWAYLSSVTLTQSPWLGLGYLAGTREYGMQYDALLGAGHSVFFEVFVGGGILAASAFLLLFVMLAIQVRKLLHDRNDTITFAACTLFLAMFVLGVVGGDIDSSPYGFMFWCIVTMVPFLNNRSAQLS